MSTKTLLAIKDTAEAWCNKHKKTALDLSELLGINYNSFRKKINPDKSQANPQYMTPDELLRLMQATGDYRVLKVMADECEQDTVYREDRISNADDVLLHQMYCMQHGSDADQDIRAWLAKLDIKRSEVLNAIHSATRRLMTLAEKIHG
ncbi:phage regulatory CII family protein [Chromobacterium violaceum]|uniref:phage regulatory CII family protein n=1 Tax=Chromobacterium violaceum TaxID=536 RepID=UPI0005B84CA3|nr:phage regulatory CII family protein [Chromobacterium violaceum]